MNKIVPTNDGSPTLQSAVFGEHYHSIHGALTESLHVFIQNGFNTLQDKKNTSVLEMGLGTGLNAFLTLKESQKYGVNVDYVAYEQFPITMEEAENLSYASDNEKDLFLKIHNLPWNERILLSNSFHLEKRNQDFKLLNEKQKYDLVYFDAFAPDCQPELWTTEIFLKIHRALKKEGFLVTYCAKGYVKRNLKEAGFKVITLPGPTGKREMTKAVKLDLHEG